MIIMVMPVYAHASSYRGYTYDSDDQALPSKIGYLPKVVYDFGNAAAYNGRIRTPQDFFISEKGMIYLLDSGNNRVLILDSDMNMVGAVDEYIMDDEILTLNNPTGIFVDKDDIIYIADPSNFRVVASTTSGEVIRLYTKPVTNLLPQDLEFAPAKVIVDRTGMLYVAAKGIYQGAVLFRSDGSFEGFYGSNRVEITPMLLLDRFWKNILSSEQADNISRYIPEEFTSFDIDDRDFVYTVTQTASITKKIKKLNPVGNDIMDGAKFGEREQIFQNGAFTASRFVDINVGSQGYINVLDQQNNRIFQYDREGNLLFIFGGRGQQSGTFINPVAIDSLNNDIFVLDSVKANITVFTPTDFGSDVHKAIDLHNEGLYGEAAIHWNEILKEDRNYETAYRSIGKALMADKEYKEAALYFRRGNDRKGNSDAFQAWRNLFLQNNFATIFAVIIIILIILVSGREKYLRKRKITDSEKETVGKIKIVRLFFNPIETSEEMKHYGYFPILKASLILIFWFLLVVAQYSLTGFRFNTNRIEEMNLTLLFLRTIPVFLVWVISNWGVCTLMDGKGKMKEIFVISSYSLIPYLGSVLIFIVSSHFITISEVFMIQMFMYAGIIWSIAILLGALSGIHEYNFTNTLVSVVLTIAGVFIVAFLLLLVTSLFRQAYSFVYSVLHEIFYRLR